jgi:MoaA/NifB/PqqE/SkfB family radical SAM enzyme
MTEYVNRKILDAMPRIPSQGNLDLTYRCNNDCLHCWLRIAPGSPEKDRELSVDEIRRLVTQSRQLGCRRWSLSGGEPLLRPDFAEIFDMITSLSSDYTLNTNGTLITPQIAQLMKKKGSKMVAIYGATAEVHDRVTRNPGSFEAVMRGFAYLKEAGAGFTVQIVPMRENYSQLKAMVDLAKSLSQDYRIGAAWLHLSACGDPRKNQEIREQRLPPRTVVELDTPDVSDAESSKDSGAGHYSHLEEDDRLFAGCIQGRREFHVDPYGGISFCSFVKDPLYRYDLRQGSFQEAWDVFIPSLSEKVSGGKEYLENCGACENRDECRWCPVFGYLEHRRFSAKVEYLCDVAQEDLEYKKKWIKNHRRYYGIAGITVKVESDLPIIETTFDPKFESFRLEEPGDDVISIRHHFSLPRLQKQDLGTEVYRRPPWAIYQKGSSWIYLGIPPQERDEELDRMAVFNENHTHARIYSRHDKLYREGKLGSLTMFPTDQILLARVLADREGCYFHSSGVKLDDKGFLFVGHSEAGKSTTVTMLKEKAEILCDDRIIVRKKAEGFRIYGTWSHGDVPDVSAASAPLQAILFLKQSPGNRIVPVEDRKDSLQNLLACLITPLETTDWWEKTLSFIETLVKGVPCYTMYFNKSGEIIESLRSL